MAPASNNRARWWSEVFLRCPPVPGLAVVVGLPLPGAWAAPASGRASVPAGRPSGVRLGPSGCRRARAPLPPPCVPFGLSLAWCSAGACRPSAALVAPQTWNESAEWIDFRTRKPQDSARWRPIIDEADRRGGPPGPDGPVSMRPGPLGLSHLLEIPFSLSKSLLRRQITVSGDFLLTRTKAPINATQKTRSLF